MGRKRAHNEDAFALHDETGLFIMCDGMGGHASGEVASQLAVEEIARFFNELCRTENFEWPYDLDDSLSFVARALQGSVLYANDRIFVESMKKSELEGMGTTVCVLASDGEDVVLAHVGDSRVYRYRETKLSQLTEDHSLLNHYRRTGELTEDELKALGHKKNVIVRALGLKDDVEVDIALETKEHGDIFLLCSDGLTDCVADWLIEQTLGNLKHDLALAAQKLVDLANENGGKDNITVLLLRVEEEGAKSFEWTPTIPEASNSGFEEETAGRNSPTIPVSKVLEDVANLQDLIENDDGPPAPPHPDVPPAPPIPDLEAPPQEASAASSATDGQDPPKKRRLKIVVSSGEVDLFGDAEEASSTAVTEEFQHQDLEGDTVVFSRLAQTIEDPVLRDILQHTLPGLVPELEDNKKK